jgi:hypothetical protein
MTKGIEQFRDELRAVVNRWLEEGEGIDILDIVGALEVTKLNLMAAAHVLEQEQKDEEERFDDREVPEDWARGERE